MFTRFRVTIRQKTHDSSSEKRETLTTSARRTVQTTADKVHLIPSHCPFHPMELTFHPMEFTFRPAERKIYQRSVTHRPWTATRRHLTALMPKLPDYFSQALIITGRLMGRDSFQFHDLQVFYLRRINGEAHERAHFLPPLNACGTRIDVQQTQGLVVLHFQYVGMAADEQLRRRSIDRG